MDNFRSNEPPHSGPHDRGPGFRLGPHRAPHHAILEGIEHVSAQVTDVFTAMKAENQALHAKLDQLIANQNASKP